MSQYDIGVIGSGPAGLAAAFAAAQQGLSVVIIENYLWGGTCPNYGCDPKKILLSAVETIEQQQALSQRGIVGQLSVDWSALMAHKQAYVDAVEPRKIRGLQNAGITRAFGTAQFIDTHTIKLRETSETIQANDWVIAVGQRAKTLDFIGAELTQAPEAFMDLATMPEDITFIGGGYIGMEFATIAQAAGAHVRLVTRGAQVLREFDQTLVNQAVDHMQDAGVNFYFEREVVSVEQIDDGLRVTLTDGEQFVTQRVFVAAGRVGNHDRLHLEKVGVNASEQDIVVNEYLQTANPHIYAIGDVAGSPVPKIVPVGNHEGRYVIERITNQTTAPIVYPTTPVVAFTTPRIAQTGVSPVNALSAGHQLTDIDMSQVMPFYRIQDAARMRTVLNDAGEIIGASVIAQNAEELINYFVTAINEKRDVKATQANFYAYPSLGSEFSTFYG
jgi:glutathione reductase (NADPH)